MWLIWAVVLVSNTTGASEGLRAPPQEGKMLNRRNLPTPNGGLDILDSHVETER